MPADPGAAAPVHDRLKGRHQATWRRSPIGGAIRVLDPIDWEPVRHHNEGGRIKFPFLGFQAHERRDLLRRFLDLNRTGHRRAMELLCDKTPSRATWPAAAGMANPTSS